MLRDPHEKFPSPEFAEAVARLGEGSERRRAALWTTEFEHEESAVVEWLLTANAVDNYAALRERFVHRLRGVEDETLARVQAVLRLTTDALWAGDGEGLRIVGDTWERLFGVVDQGSKI